MQADSIQLTGNTAKQKQGRSTLDRGASSLVAPALPTLMSDHRSGGFS
jgi:hypothetical protein